MLRGVALVGVVCALSACLDITPYGGPGRGDGGSLPPIDPLVVEGDPAASEEVIVRTGEFRVVFPYTSQVLQFPERVEVDGLDVLAQDARCAGVDRAGIQIDPAFTFSSRVNVQSIAGQSNLTIPERGSANAQVRVVWSLEYGCNGRTHTANGHSRFSFFPDGRVIRSDTITPTGDTNGLHTEAVANCGCFIGSMNSMYLSSFLALATQPFTRYAVARVDDPSTAETGLLPLPGDAGTGEIDAPNPVWACFVDDGPASRRVAVAWPTPESAADDNGTRIRSYALAGGGATVASWDWIHEAASGIEGPAIPMSVYTTQSAWFLDAGADVTCDAAAITALRTAYVAGPPLGASFDNGTASAWLDPTDGIYHLTPGELVPTPPRYEIQTAAAVRPGFAVSVLLATDASPAVRRGGVGLGADTDYLAQARPEGSGFRHTLWFAGGLASGELLVIGEP